MTPLQIPLDAKSLTLASVLGAAEYKVPDFQRPYSWKDEHIKDFWDDILDASKPDASLPHFFGTLLTAPASEHPAGGSRLDVLDGQQRLTTFTLLLIALDRHLETIDVDGASKRVRDGAKHWRQRIREAFYVQDSRRRLRLRNEDDHLLANLLTGNPGGAAIGKAFLTLHEHVDQQLKASEDMFGELERLAAAVLDRSIVIHANCRAGFDPFVVFSTLNATGLPLTATQILRARSLGLVQGLDDAVAELTRESWDLVENLGVEGDRFLQAFLVLRTGERVQTKDIVRLFDRLVLKTRSLDQVDKESHLEAVAREISHLAPIYKDLSEGKWPATVTPVPDAWHVGRIRMLVRNLGIKQILPLLLATAAKKPLMLGDVVDIIERAAFVALVCLDNQTRWGDRAFSLAAGVYKSEVDLKGAKDSIQEFFAAQLLKPAEVLRRRLPEQLRYNGRRKTLIRYFLTTLNDWGYPSTAIPGSEPDIQASWTLSDIHIDHISPQKGAGPIPEAERDRLGNLTALKGKSNIAASNKPFPDKLAFYGDSPLRLTRALKDVQAWDMAALEEREEAMTTFGVALYCRDLAPIISED
jgi:hypothetical protein